MKKKKQRTKKKREGFTSGLKLGKAKVFTGSATTRCLKSVSG